MGLASTLLEVAEDGFKSSPAKVLNSTLSKTLLEKHWALITNDFNP
jgi:hypothetical protein